MVQIPILRSPPKSSPDLTQRLDRDHVLLHLSSCFQKPLQNNDRRVVIVRFGWHLHRQRQQPPPPTWRMVGKVPASGKKCGVFLPDNRNGNAWQLDRQMPAGGVQPCSIPQDHLVDCVVSFPFSQNASEVIRPNDPSVENRPIDATHDLKCRSSRVNNENPHHGTTNRTGIIAQASTG